MTSIFEVVQHSSEQKRQRRAACGRPQHRAVEGDASTFIDDTIPHGAVMRPGELFVKSWTIRNSGRVSWQLRRMERQGPCTGPGLITSPRYFDVPDTEPGEIVRLSVGLRAPGYPCSSVAYFKMVDAGGSLCFPDDYQLGLDVLVRVTEMPRNHDGQTR